MAIWLRILISKSICSLQVGASSFASVALFESSAQHCLLLAVEQTLNVEEALDTLLQVILVGLHVSVMASGCAPSDV